MVVNSHKEVSDIARVFIIFKETTLQSGLITSRHFIICGAHEKRFESKTSLRYFVRFPFSFFLDGMSFPSKSRIASKARKSFISKIVCPKRRLWGSSVTVKCSLYDTDPPICPRTPSISLWGDSSVSVRS